jgi:hypothetical protein
MHSSFKRNKCYWCGKKATSEDHVPPKQLFYKVNYQPIKNPSCRKHNEDFSKIDYRGSIYITGATRNKIAEKLFEEKIGKSLKHIKSIGLLNALLEEIRFDNNGNVFDASINSQIIDLYFEKIIRGIFFYHKQIPSKRRIVKCFSRKFEDKNFNYSEADFMINGFKTHSTFKEGKIINPEIFKYEYNEYKGFFYVIITYFKDIIVVGIITPKYFKIRKIIRNIIKLRFFRNK